VMWKKSRVGSARQSKKTPSRRGYGGMASHFRLSITRPGFPPETGWENVYKPSVTTSSG
jgi:hypothetical protein